MMTSLAAPAGWVEFDGITAGAAQEQPGAGTVSCCRGDPQFRSERHRAPIAGQADAERFGKHQQDEF